MARGLTTKEVFALPVGRLHHLIVDCPDPMAEARFWSAVLGDPITYADEDFVVVSASTTASGLAFQGAAVLTPPTWPEPGVPQQMHLDVMVDDEDAAGEAVLALGARRLPMSGHLSVELALRHAARSNQSSARSATAAGASSVMKCAASST
ncbi:VOC family protein [Micromonospora sp. DT47]|uniref:VOC family protein n=1 Tax=Micromonospora sp. DT47 TaxID=3393431 RepID=UPI003CF0C6DD